MRTMLLLLLILLGGLARTGLAGSYYMDAYEQYNAGKFKEARENYELMQAGSRKPWSNLYYNIGNANYRLEEPGRAALAYERALLVQPDHPEALANLKFLRGKVGSHVDERSGVERGLRLALEPLAAQVAIGLAWLGFGLIACTIIRRRGGLARWSGVLLVVLGLAVGAAVQVCRHELSRVAVVVAKSTDAHMEPADRAALAEALPAGSWVRVLSEQGDWTYCELPGGGRGWLQTKAIERLLTSGFI